jgi:hypothetical protein
MFLLPSGGNPGIDHHHIEAEAMGGRLPNLEATGSGRVRLGTPRSVETIAGMIPSTSGSNVPVPRNR